MTDFNKINLKSVYNNEQINKNNFPEKAIINKQTHILLFKSNVYDRKCYYSNFHIFFIFFIC